MFSENSFMVMLLENLRGCSAALGAPCGLRWMWVRAANVQAGMLTVVLRSVG